MVTHGTVQSRCVLGKRTVTVTAYGGIDSGAASEASNNEY